MMIYYLEIPHGGTLLMLKESSVDVKAPRR